jgi:hypothetical protein
VMVVSRNKLIAWVVLQRNLGGGPLGHPKVFINLVSTSGPASSLVLIVIHRTSPAHDHAGTHVASNITLYHIYLPRGCG